MLSDFDFNKNIMPIAMRAWFNFSKLSSISAQIKKLEDHEIRILNGGIFEDDLLDTAENQAMADNFSLAAHATNATVIMELKSLYKKIQKLT
jgi:hypothetical protein